MTKSCEVRKLSSDRLRRDSIPKSPLPLPFHNRDDPPQLPLPHRIISLRHRRQRQDLFLNVWRQIQQIHDLCQPRPAHVPQPRRVGVVANLAIPDQFLDPVGQRQKLAGKPTRAYCVSLR